MYVCVYVYKLWIHGDLEFVFMVSVCAGCTVNVCICVSYRSKFLKTTSRMHANK